MAVLVECPVCGVKDQLGKGGFAVGDWGEGAHFLVRNCANPVCKKPMFVIYHKTDEPMPPIFIYPVGGGRLDPETTFPDRVREEYAEAVRCLSINAFLASMTMSRRVLQRCLKDQGHNQYKLFEQIEAAKKDGTIPRRYHQLADELREFGNIGAHPDDDKLRIVTRENATHLVDFVKLIIEDIYVVEHRISALSQSRKSV